MTELELFKEVFRLAIGVEQLDSNNSFGEVKHSPECRYIQVEYFNRKFPSDYYKLSIMRNNNDVFLEADIFGGEDGYTGYLDQPIWNQVKIHELLKNNLMSSTYIQQVDKI